MIQKLVEVSYIPFFAIFSMSGTSVDLGSRKIAIISGYRTVQITRNKRYLFIYDNCRVLMKDIQMGVNITVTFWIP